MLRLINQQWKNIAQQFEPENFESSDDAGQNGFIIACCIWFISAVALTIYFFSSMREDMQMPGGWTMSMMWMRMGNQSWMFSGLNFLAMWLAMMVVMMMPVALPAFLKTRRRWRSLCFVAFGYFTVWLLVGIGVYVLGIAFNYAAMRSEQLSRLVPLLSIASFIAAGLFQFTGFKITRLHRCRSSGSCADFSHHDENSFRVGWKQGIDCCNCCVAFMVTQLVAGIMNPYAMVAITIIIAAERLLSRPEFTARLAGTFIILAGIPGVINWAT